LIRIWRICPARHAAAPLSGEGARLYGGRWNTKGTRMVYCAESLSLACLENLVHADLRYLPGDLMAIAIDIPDGTPLKLLEPAALPAGWDLVPGPESQKEIGAAWAAAQVEAILAVPSAVIPGERNYLINPDHPDVARLLVHPGRPFNFDSRLGLPSARL
jgi:RES domain-containing protein